MRDPEDRVFTLFPVVSPVPAGTRDDCVTYSHHLTFCESSLWLEQCVPWAWMFYNHYPACFKETKTRGQYEKKKINKKMTLSRTCRRSREEQDFEPRSAECYILCTWYSGCGNWHFHKMALVSVPSTWTYTPWDHSTAQPPRVRLLRRESGSRFLQQS